ncbi:MAG TPA: STAS domain-containing protein [Acidimicrobiia bacterium]|nr:STAS domain-containing protein [Acidimicrobiia bacterium]
MPNEGDALVDEQAVGPDLILTTERDGNGAVLTVRGELDAYSAPGLEEQIARLLAEQVNEVVLDLSQTGFLDSSGLRAILTAQRRLSESGGGMRLRAPSEPVTRLLEITGLSDHFVLDS